MIFRFDIDDAPALLDLSLSVGWTHSLADWQTALASGIVFGDREGARIQASSAVYIYGKQLASIGQVIVRSEARRQGLARALVLHCLNQAPGQPAMLVATPDGQPLYERLGFRVIEPTHRLVGDGPVGLPEPRGCRPMTAADLPLALKLDAAAYAADRGHLLQQRWKQVCHAAMLADGSGFAWSTPRNIGPLIAPTARRAAELIAFLAAGRPITVDVPAGQAEFIGLLTEAGLRSTGARPLMLLNASSLPGRRDAIFGLASLAYG